MKGIKVKLSGGTSWEVDNRKEGSQRQAEARQGPRGHLSTHCTPYEMLLLIRCCGN